MAARSSIPPPPPPYYFRFWGAPTHHPPPPPAGSWLYATGPRYGTMSSPWFYNVVIKIPVFSINLNMWRKPGIIAFMMAKCYFLLPPLPLGWCVAVCPGRVIICTDGLWLHPALSKRHRWRGVRVLGPFSFRGVLELYVRSGTLPSLRFSPARTLSANQIM